MNIFDQQIKEGRLWATLPQFKCKVLNAKRDIEAMLSLCPNSYVALSWGKQSSVLMHLVFSIVPNIVGVFWRGPESEIIANFNEVKEKFISKWPIKYCEEYCEQDFKKAAREFPMMNNFSGVFIGIVKIESKGRKYTLGKGDKNNIFRYKTGVYRCCPLSDWNNLDIAAYVAVNDIPMLYTYHRFGFDVRTSARIKMGGKSFTERGFDLLTTKKQEELLYSQKQRELEKNNK